MSSILGGSKSKSVSDNQAYKTIDPWAQNLMGYADEGASGISRTLAGDSTGLDAFKRMMGYDWEAQQGGQDILAKQAAVGGLDSGATLKGLAKYQTGLNNQYANTYLNQLLGLSGIGQNAANTLTSAGQKNVSTSKSSPGIGALAGKIAAGVATGGASAAL